MMGLEGRQHHLKPVLALVGVVDLAQLLKQLPSSHFGSAIGPAETGDALLACEIPLREHMALNQRPVNWGSRSLQMVRGTLKTVSQ